MGKRCARSATSYMLAQGQVYAAHLELVLVEETVKDLVRGELLERHAAGAFQRACCAGGGNVGVQG